MRSRSWASAKRILVGREEEIVAQHGAVGVPESAKLKIVNARLSDHNAAYTDYLYKRLQRFGFLHRDAQRLVNQDRNVFGACMVALGARRRHGDRRDPQLRHRARRRAQGDRSRARRARDGHVGRAFQGRARCSSPTPPWRNFPTPQSWRRSRCNRRRWRASSASTPRVALLSHSTFGNPTMERSEKIRDAVSILDRREDIDFEYEGEMNPDVALNPDMHGLYPFSRLTEPANVLVMPALHSASIATSLLTSVGGATVIGPMLTGLSTPDPDRAVGRAGFRYRDVRRAGGVPGERNGERAKLSGRCGRRWRRPALPLLARDHEREHQGSEADHAGVEKEHDVARAKRRGRHAYVRRTREGVLRQICEEAAQPREQRLRAPPHAPSPR